MTNNRLIDFLHNEANKEEFEGNTSPRTTAYTLVREDASTGLTYKLPLEASYAKSLTKKYYSAAEVIKYLNIALHQLRYLETKIPDLSNYKINNRKYYNVNDIGLLQKSFCEMNSCYTKINLEKSNRAVSQGAERTEVYEHPRTYKDDTANFSSIQYDSERSRQDEFQGEPAERLIREQRLTLQNSLVSSFMDHTASSRIDILLTKFHNLSFQIKKILADSSMTCV